MNGWGLIGGRSHRLERSLIGLDNVFRSVRGMVMELWKSEGVRRAQKKKAEERGAHGTERAPAPPPLLLRGTWSGLARSEALV